MPKVSPTAPRPALSSQRIAAHAFAIVDAEGVAALSTRRLASALGCQAMSLYHHVPNIEALLDLVVDQALAELLALATAEPSLPAERLLRVARAFLAAAQRHPHVYLLVGSRRWLTPSAQGLAMASAQLFERTGLAPRAALRAARVLGAYLNGAGLALSGWQRSAPGHAEASLQRHGSTALPLQARSNVDDVRADLDAGLVDLLNLLLRRAG